MMLRSAFLAACCMLAAACSRLPPGGIGLGGDCVKNADCADPYVCVGGICSFEVAQACTPAVKACVGDFVGVCNPAGSGYNLLDATDISNPVASETPKACRTGCYNGACKQEVCNATDAVREKKCDGTVILQCNSTGTRFETFQICPAGCETTASGVECKSPICNPFETRCQPGDTTSTKLETCNGNGAAWVESTCPSSPASTCEAGRCVAQVCSVTKDGTGNITARQQRCNGVVREACRDDRSGFDPVEVCSTVCLENNVSHTTSCAVPNCITGTGQVAQAFQTECSTENPDALKRCDARGLEWTTVDCTTEIGAEATCVRGRCVPKVCANASSSSREQRCSGNIREQCNDSETAFEPIASTSNAPNPCPFGCTESAGVASCRPAECTGTQEKCDGDAILRCNSEGTFTFVQLCPSGCDLTGSGATANASCKNASCNPLSRRCGLDTTNANSPTSFVEQCRADGTGFDRIEVCSSVCASGTCVLTPATCVPGNLRCRGRETELCVRLPNGDTEWRFTGYCLGTCSDGTCSDAGACSCTGSNEPPAASCGSTGRQPITVRVMLPADEPTATVPCDDGKSNVLVYSDPITDPNGRPVPDGTLITFSIATTSASDTGQLPAFVSADASAELPGLQRPTLNGRARVVISTPPQLSCPTTANVPRPLALTAKLDGRCAGTVNIPYQNRVSGTPRFTYVSDDFSRAEKASRRETTALWDAGVGRVAAFGAFDLGTGADGDATVVAGASATDFNSTFGYTFEVTALQAQSVTVNRFPTLSNGDELLIVTAYDPGQVYNGVHEFRRVASYGSNTIVFDRPLTRQFAANPSDLTGMRIVVQKVPNFTSMLVDANGTTFGELKATAPTGGTGALSGGTGIIAFRATGTVTVKGRINANGAGYNNTVSPYSNPVAAYIDRLAIGGSTNAGRGGGVVFINAGALVFTDGGPVPPFIDVSHASAGGTASPGIVYLAVGSYTAIANGSNFVRAIGGHVRFDYSIAPTAVDATDLANDFTNAGSTASTFYGQSGPYTVTSNLNFESTGGVIAKIRLVGGLFARGATNVAGAATGLPGFKTVGLLSSSSVPTETSVDLSEGSVVSGLTGTPTRFRWQTQIFPLNDQLHSVGGLSFRVCDENCN